VIFFFWKHYLSNGMVSAQITTRAILRVQSKYLVQVTPLPVILVDLIHDNSAYLCGRCTFFLHGMSKQNIFREKRLRNVCCTFEADVIVHNYRQGYRHILSKALKVQSLRIIIAHQIHQVIKRFALYWSTWDNYLNMQESAYYINID